MTSGSHRRPAAADAREGLAASPFPGGGERPRERLLRSGCECLADAELVALLLGTGTRRASALSLARRLLVEVGGVSGLLDVEPAGLQRAGLGPAKAAAVLAAVEIGRRAARARVPERKLLSHPARVAEYLRLRYCRRGQEVMGALYLDVRHRLLAERELFRGTLSRAAVEPRAILTEGLLQHAASLLLFHTHPSGDPAPSSEDLVFTRRMADAGELVGIRLLDHLILGASGRWVSLRQRGAW